MVAGSPLKKTAADVCMLVNWEKMSSLCFDYGIREEKKTKNTPDHATHFCIMYFIARKQILKEEMSKVIFVIKNRFDCIGHSNSLVMNLYRF